MITLSSALFVIVAEPGGPGGPGGPDDAATQFNSVPVEDKTCPASPSSPSLS